MASADGGVDLVCVSVALWMSSQLNWVCQSVKMMESGTGGQSGGISVGAASSGLARSCSCIR